MYRRLPSPRPLIRVLAVTAAALAAAACEGISDTRGHVANPGAVEKIETANQSREDVLRLLGSPSTVSTFNDKTWYYIRQKQEQFAFFGISTIEQSVVAISFNDSGRVDQIKTYTLKDGKEVDMVVYQTPTSGKQLTVMEQIMGNVGRFTAPNKSSIPGTMGPAGSR